MFEAFAGRRTSWRAVDAVAPARGSATAALELTLISFLNSVWICVAADELARILNGATCSCDAAVKVPERGAHVCTLASATASTVAVCNADAAAGANVAASANAAASATDVSVSAGANDGAFKCASTATGASAVACANAGAARWAPRAAADAEDAEADIDNPPVSVIADAPALVKYARLQQCRAPCMGASASVSTACLSTASACAADAAAVVFVDDAHASLMAAAHACEKSPSAYACCCAATAHAAPDGAPQLLSAYTDRVSVPASMNDVAPARDECNVATVSCTLHGGEAARHVNTVSTSATAVAPACDELAYAGAVTAAATAHASAVATCLGAATVRRATTVSTAAAAATDAAVTDAGTDATTSTCAACADAGDADVDVAPASVMATPHVRHEFSCCDTVVTYKAPGCNYAVLSSLHGGEVRVQPTYMVTDFVTVVKPTRTSTVSACTNYAAVDAPTRDVPICTPATSTCAACAAAGDAGVDAAVWNAPASVIDIATTRDEFNVATVLSSLHGGEAERRVTTVSATATAATTATVHATTPTCAADANADAIDDAVAVRRAPDAVAPACEEIASAGAVTAAATAHASAVATYTCCGASLVHAAPVVAPQLLYASIELVSNLALRKQPCRLHKLKASLSCCMTAVSSLSSNNMVWTAFVKMFLATAVCMTLNQWWMKRESVQTVEPCASTVVDTCHLIVNITMDEHCANSCSRPSAFRHWLLLRAVSILHLKVLQFTMQYLFGSQSAQHSQYHSTLCLNTDLLLRRHEVVTGVSGADALCAYSKI